jgi:hypothetical protein
MTSIEGEFHPKVLETCMKDQTMMFLVLPTHIVSEALVSISYGGEERCIWGLGGETRGKGTT